MEDIWKNLKELVSWIWKPAKTHEEKVIKRYDILIAVCVVFMLAYTTYFVFNLDSKIDTNINSPSSSQIVTDPNVNPALYVGPDTKTHPLYPTNSLTDREFYVGEIIGVRYFGVFGLVRQKTLGTRGYTYTLRYENSERDLMDEDFYAWELYRPLPGSVPISVLRQ